MIDKEKRQFMNEHGVFANVRLAKPATVEEISKELHDNIDNILSNDPKGVVDLKKLLGQI